MAREKTNRYKIVTDGLQIENNLYTDWCESKTDEEIIKAILLISGYSKFSFMEFYKKQNKDITFYATVEELIECFREPTLSISL